MTSVGSLHLKASSNWQAVGAGVLGRVAGLVLRLCVTFPLANNQTSWDSRPVRYVVVQLKVYLGR